MTNRIQINAYNDLILYFIGRSDLFYEMGVGEVVERVLVANLELAAASAVFQRNHFSAGALDAYYRSARSRKKARIG